MIDRLDVPVILCALAGVARADSRHASPRVVVTECDRSIRDDGAETTTFVLYANGNALFQDDQGQFRSVELSDRERADIMTPLAAWPTLKNEYRLSELTDQTTTRVCVWSRERKCVAVYGADSGSATRLPKPLSNALASIAHYRNARARPWTAHMLELTLQPSGGGRIVSWPKAWGAPTVTEKRSIHTLLLEGRFEPELDQLIARNRGQPWVLDIDGRPWVIWSIHRELPGEREWRRRTP